MTLTASFSTKFRSKAHHRPLARSLRKLLRESPPTRTAFSTASATTRENSFSVDGQPITDQQSKVFSNQIPMDSIQSLTVIDGAPPAEYGGKTSLVIDVTTRSGQGVTTPHGSATAAYGTFGTVNGGFDLAYGGQKWGNFISLDGLNTSRFLDPPEFVVMHDKGNEENAFDRLDYQISHGRFSSSQPRILAFLVPNAEFLRFSIRFGMEWRDR